MLWQNIRKLSRQSRTISDTLWVLCVEEEEEVEELQEWEEWKEK